MAARDEDQTFMTAPTGSHQPPASRESTVRTFAWIALGFGTWITGGLILLLWALDRGYVEDAFVSAYIVPFYLGLGSLSAFCATRMVLAVRRGEGWRNPLPRGYDSLAVGVTVAVVGLVVELGWREGIGIAPGIEEMIAPTRTAIILGLVLIAIAPLRAALVQDAGQVPRLVVLASAALVLAIAGLAIRSHPAIMPWLEQADLPPYLPDGLWVMDADGSNLTRLLEEDDPAIGLGYASWSPDGTLIAYSRFEIPDQDETRTDADVWIVEADGTNAHAVVDGDGMQWIPRISPDGNSIAYTQEEAGGPWANAGPVGPGPGAGPGGGVPVGPLSVPLANADLWQVSAAGTRSPRQLSDSEADDRAPVYSPDGSTIIFDSTRDGNTEIYALDLASGAERRLTVEPGEDWGATWSPDGTHIAFNSDRNGPMDIYVMASDGSGVRRVTFTTVPDSGNVAPSWSPDGSRIAYTARTGNEPSEIWSVRSTGGDARNLSRSQLASDDLWTGGWGPDGRIAFSRALPSSPENSFLAREDLGVASMLLSALVLAIVVVSVVQTGWSFGSFTLALSLAIALIAITVEAWRFLVVGPVIGLAVDVALYRSAPRHWAQVAGATAAAGLVLTSGLVILATSQLGWSPTLVLGVASAAGVLGWGVGAIGSREGRSERTSQA